MLNKSGRQFSIALAMACASVVAAKAGEQDGFSDLFQRNQYQLTLSSGFLFSPVGAVHNRPTLNYTLSALQLGWMFTDVQGSGWLRGNWETAIEAIGGAVDVGRGNYLAGGTAWMKYNFVQPGWRMVPYLAGGAGAEATDMDPRLVGETFNFNLNVAVGMKWFVAPRWALDVQCRYQHISNATLAAHDLGINAVGPVVGLSYFF